MSESGLENCSFCGKHKDAVAKLIVSESAAICNECVDLCQDLLVDQPRTETYDTNRNDPHNIKTFLDQYVVSQTQAKITLSVAVVNHYKRMHRTDSDPEISKANILMLGPTGSGKTLLASTIARCLDVPFAIADATSITEAGYVGDDVETLILRLYANAGHDVTRTQRGIVFIDEIDKISRRSESASLTRDVSGEGVQQALLKLVEGTVCRVPPQPGRKHPAGEVIEIDTTDILFIASGAFVGLDAIVSRRQQGTNIGFATPLPDRRRVDLKAVCPDDLVKFGLIPEFVGRFPTRVVLDHLAESDLMAILTDVKHNLPQQYQWLMQQDGIALDFSASALQELAHRAHESGTGARALHSELEKVMIPHMYAAREYVKRGIDRVDVTPDLVNNPMTL